MRESDEKNNLGDYTDPSLFLNLLYLFFFCGREGVREAATLTELTIFSNLCNPWPVYLCKGKKERDKNNYLNTKPL